MKSFPLPFRLILTLIIVFLVTYIGVCQSVSLFAGYKGVPWGSSLSEVSAVFPNLEEQGMPEDNLLLYIQKKPIDGVINRNFYFWDGRLVKVSLFYYQDFIASVGFKEFIDHMKESFGPPKNEEKNKVLDDDGVSWQVGSLSWEDANTSISFKSRETREPKRVGIYMLEFQSVKLLKEIQEGKASGVPQKDWGW
jgi:hypothetical protein